MEAKTNCKKRKKKEKEIKNLLQNLTRIMIKGVIYLVIKRQGGILKLLFRLTYINFFGINSNEFYIINIDCILKRIIELIPLEILPWTFS